MELNNAAASTPAVQETAQPAVATQETTQQATAEAPKVETPEEEKSPSPKDDPKFAAKFAALSKREKAIMQKEQAFKEQQARFSKYEADMKTFEEDPIKWLESKGLTFDKLTQRALNDGKKPPEERIKELEDRITQKEKEREENEKKSAQERYEAQKSAFVTEIGTFLEKNADTYELTTVADEPAELIYSVIEAHYKKTNRILPIQEAAELVEKHFESELESKYLSKKKVQSKFVPKAPEPTAPSTPKAPSQTLTNTQAANVPTPSTNKALSIEESKRAAAQLLKWT